MSEAVRRLAAFCCFVAAVCLGAAIALPISAPALAAEPADMVVMTNSDNGSILAEALIRKAAAALPLAAPRGAG